MKTKQLQIYNVKTIGIKILIIIAFALTLCGLYGIIGFFWFKENLIISKNIWFYIYLISQGAIQIYLGLIGLKNRQYFMFWSDSEIRFLLPKSKQTEIIKIEQIQSIKINNQEVKILMENQNEKKFNLNLLFIPKRNLAVEYFEYVKNIVENRN